MPPGWDKQADWKFIDHPMSMQQVNETDCGTAMVTHTLYHLCDVADDRWPSKLESIAWRAVVHALVKGTEITSVDGRNHAHIIDLVTSKAEARDIDRQISEAHSGNQQREQPVVSVVQCQKSQTQPLLDGASRAVDMYRAFAVTLRAREHTLSHASNLLKEIHHLANSQMPTLTATRIRLESVETTSKAQIKAAQTIVNATTVHCEIFHAIGLSSARSNVATMTTELSVSEAKRRLQF